MLSFIPPNDVDILKEVFYQDGSLRDIYVCETTVDDWQKLISFLKFGKYPHSYQLDSSTTPLPSEFSDIQKHMGEAVQLLTIDIQGISLNCHFFRAEDIELDLLPNEVDSEEKAEAVFRFMAEIGELLGKDVIVTPENGQEYVTVRYNAKTNEIEYVQG